MAVNNAQLADLRGKRRRLLRNEEIGESTEALRQAVHAIQNGPEQLTEFDEALFDELVERITVGSNGNLCFRLRGGIELAERLVEGGK